MDKLEHYHEFAKNTVAINWCILNICNYKCSYCPHFLHSGSSGVPNLDKTFEFCTNVIEHCEEKNVHFEFTGGEVTLWREFPDLVLFLKSHKNVHVGVISNGSSKLEWWDDMKKHLDNACLSFQPEFSKRDHYVALTKLINGYMRTHVNLMMHPRYFDLCLDVVEEIVSNVPNISVALQPLLVDFKDELYNYTDRQLEILDKQFELYGSRVKWNKEWPVFRGSMIVSKDNKTFNSASHVLISDGTNRWKGWKCYVGVEQIIITPDGQIFRGWCLEGGSIGSINEFIELPTQPIICSKDYCHCNFDIMCTKEKIK